MPTSGEDAGLGKGGADLGGAEGAAAGSVIGD